MRNCKVKLQLIENEASRRNTFTKRVRGVIKKTNELSVLCGVEVCTVIYGPNSEAPVVWPSSEAEVKRIISNFKEKSEFDQSQRRFDQDAFLKQRIAKTEEKLSRLQRRNRELEMENLVTDILVGKKTLEQVPRTDLGDLLWVLNDKLVAIEHRKTMAQSLPPVVPQDAAAPQDVVANESEGGDHGCAGPSFTDDDYELTAVVEQYFPISDTPTQTLMETGSSQSQSA